MLYIKRQVEQYNGKNVYQIWVQATRSKNSFELSQLESINDPFAHKSVFRRVSWLATDSMNICIYVYIQQASLNCFVKVLTMWRRKKWSTK